MPGMHRCLGICRIRVMRNIIHNCQHLEGSWVWDISPARVQEPQVPQTMHRGEFQEHLETRENTFYSKIKVELTINTSLHCFLTGHPIGWYLAVEQSLTAFHTLFSKKLIIPVKSTEAMTGDTLIFPLLKIMKICVIFQTIVVRPWHLMQYHGLCVSVDRYANIN